LGKVKYFQHTSTPDRVEKSEKDRDKKTLNVQETHHELSRGVPPWHEKSAKKLKKGSPSECCKGKSKGKCKIEKKIENTVMYRTVLCCTVQLQ